MRDCAGSDEARRVADAPSLRVVAQKVSQNRRGVPLAWSLRVSLSFKIPPKNGGLVYCLVTNECKVRSVCRKAYIFRYCGMSMLEEERGQLHCVFPFDQHGLQSGQEHR